MSNDESSDETGPVKVCPKCSVQAQTTGLFCAHCGASYSKRRRKPSRKSLAAVVVAVVLVAGAGSAVALKIRHDRAEEREERAAEQLKADRDAEEEAERVALNEANEREKKRELKQDAVNAERDIRTALIKQMQTSITKDARQSVSDGVLDGPILYTSCDPLGGGSVDDLTALTTTFDCIAVNERLNGTQVRGYGFDATMNWDETSWSWQLQS